jgi:hypothetical protein
VFSNGLGYDYNYCWLAGNIHHFEWPHRPNKIKCNENGTVTIGCGILLNQKNKMFIFFTANGIQMGKFWVGLTINLYKT